MKVASSRFQRVLALLMLAASLAYLVPFVPRGWVPHDEGMLGQSAERVMRGELPHVDYQEPYTGGLSWLYAATFHVSGVDLLHIRWLLFAGAAAATLLTYSILRRFLRPISSIVAQLFAIAPEGIVEWVDKEDAMVQAMLSLRPDVYTDYTWSAFEEAIRTHGEFLQVRATHEGRRRLCHVRSHAARRATLSR